MLVLFRVSENNAWMGVRFNNLCGIMQGSLKIGMRGRKIPLVKSLKRILCVAVLLLSISGVNAALEFKKTEHRVTSGVHDMKMTFDFPFVNKSDKEVKIERLEVSCSCLKAWMPDNVTKYASGASGTVKVEIDLGAFGGKVEKEAYVVTSEAQKIPLKLVVSVPQFVKVEPQTLKWEVGEALSAKKMTLTVHKELNLNLEKVSISQKVFDYTPRVVQAGRKYEIIVTPKSTESPEFALMSIMTNSELPRYKKILAYLAINKAGESSNKKK